MTSKAYAVWECPQCRLRFPALEGQANAGRCPHCGAKTNVVMQRELVMEPAPAAESRANRTVEALLDNIRSAGNVGAMFRTADGVGIRKLHLCGITPSPPHDGIAKTALGADESVPWEYYKNAVDAARGLKERGAQLWALELDSRAVPLTESASADADLAIVLIIGNEITGVDPDVLSMCDQIVHLPMLGQKRSLNAAVAFGIAAYSLTFLKRARG